MSVHPGRPAVAAAAGATEVVAEHFAARAGSRGGAPIETDVGFAAEPTEGPRAHPAGGTRALDGWRGWC